ncbi:unnamed protein product [Blepharisma stoltei]|uniref:USP domain-containing protein n=1 Tax=Blepharisma stoltei TaxID=1481888 RepID=A0AAU9IT73_9CILI|nr:unnamed protein product [Blepharisma stoltei]
MPPNNKLNAKRCLENIKSKEDQLNLQCEVCQEINSFTVKVDSFEMPKILVFYVTDTSSKNRKPETEINFQESDYKLYAVICYYKAEQCSHYIAYTCEDEKWYQFNDAFVTEDLPDYDHAYMLFYSKLGNSI